LAREFLGSLLTKRGGHHITYASSFDELMRALAPGHPFELAIVDLDLPGMSGDLGLKHVHQTGSSAKIVVLASLSEEDASRLSRRLEFGQVVSRHLAPHQLLRAVKGALAAPEPRVAPIGEQTARARQPRPQPDLFGHQLTPRQRTILDLIVAGLTNRQIGKLLGISEGTVKAHINSAYKIMGVHNRVNAAAAYSRVTRADTSPEDTEFI
jgi:DNA-binding NarL/FixJ family response regulator